MESLFLALGATLIIGAGAGVVLSATYPLIRPGLLKKQPRQRANAQLGWAVAPLGIGIFFTALLFMPSLLNRLGIPAGHCHNHGDRLPHICLTNPPLSGSETLPWYLLLALTALAAGFLVSQAVHLHKVARLKAALRRAGSKSADYNLVLWGKPAAFTVGFWTPQIFISKSLAKALSPEQIQVVIAHEKGHVKHRDPLRQYLGTALSFLHCAGTRRSILEDLILATEQACDDEAALQLGDRLQVAETILTVERILHNTQRAVEASAVGFAAGNSALRIRALLSDGVHQEPSYPGWLLFFPLLVVTSLVMPGPVHYFTELIISHS